MGSLEGVHPENLANFNFTMFRFVALIAFVAVAAAEPQWGVEHMKTPSGDTVSVQAAKVQHHQMKAAEYVKDMLLQLFMLTPLPTVASQYTTKVSLLQYTIMVYTLMDSTILASAMLIPILK